MLDLKGNPKPTLELCPPFFSSVAQDCIDFASWCGLELLDWQKYVVEQSMVLDRHGRFVPKEVGLIVPRQNGKGAVLEAVEMFCLFVLNMKKVIHSAHEFKTSLEHFKRIRTLIERRPELQERIASVKTGNTAPGVYLKPAFKGDVPGELRFMARTGGSGRGFQGDLIVFDEAYALRKSFQDALMPTMATRENYQLWYASSAGFLDSEVLRSVKERAVSGEDGLAFFEWGVDFEEGLDFADPELWVRVNPSAGKLIPVEFLAAEFSRFRAADNVEGFAREHLGLWDFGAEGSLVSEGSWVGCEAPDSEVVGDSIVVCVDVDLDRRAAVCVAGLSSDGGVQVELVRVDKKGLWVREVVSELVERWDVGAVVVDASGPAGGLLADLMEVGVDPKVVGAQGLARASQLFVDRVESGVLRHVGQEPLTHAVLTAKRRRVGDSWAFARGNEVSEGCVVVAAALAVSECSLEAGEVALSKVRRAGQFSWVW